MLKSIFCVGVFAVAAVLATPTISNIQAAPAPEQLVRGWNELLNGNGDRIFDEDLNNISEKSTRHQDDEAVLKELNALLNQDEILKSTYSKYREIFGSRTDMSPLRMDIFKGHVLKIAAHNLAANAGKKTWWMGLNSFTDLSPTEIDQMLESEESFESFNVSNVHISNPSGPSGVSFPPEFSWANQNPARVSVAKDHKNAAPGVFLATIDVVESVIAIKQNFPMMIELSVQQLIDCAPGYCAQSRRCSPNPVLGAIDYLRMNPAYLYNDYPSKDPPVAGQCLKLDKKKFGYVNGPDPYRSVAAQGDEEIMELVSRAPVIVMLHASKSFQEYRNGVFLGSDCGSSPGNHPVALVGWGTDASGQNYWLIKNNWGQKWGIQGFAKVARNGNNICNLYNNIVVVNF